MGPTMSPLLALAISVVYAIKADKRVTVHEKALFLLRVVGRLPLLDGCHRLGRQASDKPQGRKLRDGLSSAFRLGGSMGV